ncbi:MAG: hypothetical protein DHS20C16_14080 [Phycisphaerae bacterium]|nr:MAG: hypothetical protein DHS20C16_14080 [Phycisphaerae bacterium]
MIRENIRITIAWVLLLTFTAQAQVETEVETPDKPIVPADVAEAAGLKSTAKPSPNRARQIGMLKQFENEITRSLEMDEDQATEISEVFRDYIDGLSEEVDDRREARRENAEIIRELVDEMREAQKDRDMERVTELREEIGELRAEYADAEEPLNPDEFFDELRELMSEDQIETFDPLADRFKKRIAGPNTKAQKSKLKLYKKAAHSINLPEDQMAAVREIFVDFAKESRGAKGAAVAEADEELLEMILDELDEDQAREFIQKVDNLEKMQNRGRGDRRSERKRRGAARDKIEAVEEPIDEEVEDAVETNEADVERIREEPAGEDIEDSEE